MRKQIVEFKFKDKIEQLEKEKNDNIGISYL